VTSKAPIFRTGVVEVSDVIIEFLIYSKDYDGGFGGKLFDLEEIYHYTEAKQPKMITIMGACMHGREIVAFLEYFLSKKYKLILFELSFKRTLKSHRVIIIKLQKMV
jgi:hypothetical protein